MSSLAMSIRDKEQLEVYKAFKHFHPGARVDIQLNTENPFRLKGKLIGFDEGQYVILSVPAQYIREYPDIIHDGRGAVVRTLMEGVAGQCVAFRTNVQYVPVRPKGQILVNFPKQIESISLRKESRMSTKLSVVIMHRDENNAEAKLDAKTELNGQIIDISSGGCRITVDWPQGQPKIQEVPVFLKVAVGNKSENTILKAVIKSQTRDDPATVSLGLMFVQDANLTQLLKEINL